MVIVLVLHVVIALCSVGYATYVLLNPSEDRLRISYGLVATTLFSGTYLAIGSSEHLLRTCLMGLAYTAIISVASFAAQRRLTAEKARDDRR